MTTEVLHDQNLEKQMGCMAGLLQLFDRHQILTVKRLYATKRLPHTPTHSPKVESMPEPERSTGSPSYSRVSEKESQTTRSSLPSPEHSRATENQSPVPGRKVQGEVSAKLPLPLHVFEFKEGTRSSWKFKEAPRLSLDSRATVDARGSLYPKQIRTNAAISRDGIGTSDDSEKQRRSPSVIARLMGLEPLQNSPSSPEPSRKAELRRSASESRVSRDLFQFRFSVDGNTFQMKQPQQQSNFESNVMMRDNIVGIEDRARDLLEFSSRSAKSEPPNMAVNRGFAAASPRKSPQHRKSYFDSADFFPVPKQAMSVYGEIERRLKMRGIDEPSQDLENLKQIFEALQLKGLLHSSRKHKDQINRNFVYDRQFSPYESPIIVMKPSRSRRVVNDSPPSSFRSRSGGRRNPNDSGEIMPTASPRRERPEIHRSNAQNQPRLSNSNSPTRSDGSTTSALSRRKPLIVETQKKANDQQRRFSSSPTHSPKLTCRGSGKHLTVSRSPRNRKPAAEIFSKEDESSSVSAESTLSTSSQTDTERSKGLGGYSRGGSSILERCDKLLHSIAEITASELQPSPVSVLDMSFYKEESSPSPVMTRSVAFGDLAAELEDEIWPPAISPELSEENSGDYDFLYVSEILRASNCLRDDSDIFLLLEKQQYLKGRNTSKESRLQRKLIFDTINEILDRKRKLPPWKSVSNADPSAGDKPQLQQVWVEFQKIRDVDASEDLFEVICGVLRKDLDGDGVSGWGDCPFETSELVLYVERQVFKDLISETVQSLASSARKTREITVPRRKLVF